VLAIPDLCGPFYRPLQPVAPGRVQTPALQPQGEKPRHATSAGRGAERRPRPMPRRQARGARARRLRAQKTAARRPSGGPRRRTAPAASAAKASARSARPPP